MRACFQKFSFNCRLCFQFESFNELVRILTHVQRAFQILKISQLESTFQKRKEKLLQNINCKHFLTLDKMCLRTFGLFRLSTLWTVEYRVECRVAKVQIKRIHQINFFCLVDFTEHTQQKHLQKESTIGQHDHHSLAGFYSTQNISLSI